MGYGPVLRDSGLSVRSPASNEGQPLDYHPDSCPLVGWDEGLNLLLLGEGMVPFLVLWLIEGKGRNSTPTFFSKDTSFCIVG